jgi:hypothetical protein
LTRIRIIPGFAFIALILTTVLVACGANTDVGSGVSTSGGVPEQQELLRSILLGMGSSSIETIRIGTPPGCPKDCPDPEKPTAAWLEIVVRGPAEGPESVRAYWDGLLLAGAFRDLSVARGLPEVLGKTIFFLDGDSEAEPGPETIISQPVQHLLEPSTREEIEALIRDGAEHVGLEVESVAFVRPMEDVVSVVARADDAESAIARHDLILQELAGKVAYGDLPAVEGIFVEILDGTGTPIAASAYSHQTGEGLGWTDAELTEAAGL